MKIQERITRTRHFAFRIFVRAFAFAGAYRMLARLCRRYFVEIKDGERLPVTQTGRAAGKITVLVLDYDRFRGDADIFSRAPDIRIISVSWSLLFHLLCSYVYNPTQKELDGRVSPHGIRFDFALAKPGSKIFQEREKYRTFLRRFLPEILGMFGIDVIMNSDFRYRREADIVRVVSELGYPHICYYREAMYTVPAYYYHAVERHRIFGPFNGCVIAVQNSITRQMFIESGMAPPDKIIVRGSPRMDALVSKLHENTAKHEKAKQIAYFSAPYGSELKDLSLKSFDLISASRKAVRALAELAKENPGIRIVIKMKDAHAKGPSGGQITMFQEEIAKVAGSNGTLPNLEFVTERMGAHDVLKSSDLVCAMQSTVVLEAAILGKPVILPHFKELRDQFGAEEVLMYQECRDLFDVPDDVDEFKRMVLERLARPEVDSETMRRRLATFEEYISPLDGHATETSLDLIRKAANSSGAIHRSVEIATKRILCNGAPV